MLVLGFCFKQLLDAASGLPREDHVWITTDQLVRFHKKNEFDEILYTLESTIRVRLKHAQPCLEGITGWSQTTHAITPETINGGLCIKMRVKAAARREKDREEEGSGAKILSKIGLDCDVSQII